MVFWILSIILAHATYLIFQLLCRIFKADILTVQFSRTEKTGKEKTNKDIWQLRVLFSHISSSLRAFTTLLVNVYFQFSSVAQSCLTLWGPMNCSKPGLPVHHKLPESTQTYVHWVSDAIQPSHPLSSPSPPAPKPSQHQGVFQWVNSSHEVAKVLEFQLQHHSFQWTPRTDLL